MHSSIYSSSRNFTCLHTQLTAPFSPLSMNHSASSSGGSGWWGPTAPRSRRWNCSRYEGIHGEDSGWMMM